MLLAPVRTVFRAVASTVVPEAASLDEKGWADVEALVEHALEPRPAAIKRQLLLLFRAIELLPVARWGRRFTKLGPDERARVLRSLQDAPLLLLRRGFWGVRTLVYLGYYARPEAARAIGYRAERLGWQRAPQAQTAPGA